MSASKWRDASRRVINDTLTGMPGVIDPNIIRRALRAAYPFGERAHHPYKIWCDEVRKTLRHFQRADRPSVFRVRVTTEGVFCSWCGNRRCLACMAAQDEYARGASALLAAFDPNTPPAILADALEDYDFFVCSRLVRAEA